MYRLRMNHGAHTRLANGLPGCPAESFRVVIAAKLEKRIRGGTPSSDPHGDARRMENGQADAPHRSISTVETRASIEQGPVDMDTVWALLFAACHKPAKSGSSVPYASGGGRRGGGPPLPVTILAASHLRVDEGQRRRQLQRPAYGDESCAEQSTSSWLLASTLER